MNKNYGILVVDDDPVGLKLLQCILIKEQFEVVATSNPEEALSLLEIDDFDLVISDYRMGKITGFDIFRKLNQLGKKAAKILITGTPDGFLEAELSELEVYKVILKPWDNESFLKTINEALANH